MAGRERGLTPEAAQTAMSVADLIVALISDGREESTESGTYSLSSKGYDVVMDSSYYLAYDEDYFGCKYTFYPQNTLAARNTTATVGVEFTYTVVGGDIDNPQTEKLEYQTTFQTNQ